MNVQNPLAFMENYKAIRARLDPQAPVRVNIAEALKPRPRKAKRPPVDHGITLPRPPHNLARTIYLCPIGPSNEDRQTLYLHPIGPANRDILNVATNSYLSAPQSTFKGIFAAVCAKYKVLPNDVLSTRRTLDVTIPRHEIFYRLKHETRLSLPSMGRLMGGRDHTTALSSIRRYARLLEEGKVRL